MLASSVSYTAFNTLDVYFDDVAETTLLCTLKLFNAQFRLMHQRLCATKALVRKDLNESLGFMDESYTSVMLYER